MNNKNIRLGFVTAASYLVGISAALALIAWLGSAMSFGGFDRFLSAEYAIGLSLGLIISFICGYSFHPLLSKSITRYANANPDMTLQFVKALCRSKLQCRYWGYTSLLSFTSAAIIFVLSGESYIEALCLLMAIGFISLYLSLQYKSLTKQTLRARLQF